MLRSLRSRRRTAPPINQTEGIIGLNVVRYGWLGGDRDHRMPLTQFYYYRWKRFLPFAGRGGSAALECKHRRNTIIAWEPVLRQDQGHERRCAGR